MDEDEEEEEGVEEMEDVEVPGAVGVVTPAVNEAAELRWKGLLLCPAPD